MKMLKTRLYDHEMKKKRAEADKLESEKADINFGSTDIYGGKFISAATLADGRVVVTWMQQGGDGNGDGIVSQIVDPRDGVVNGNSGNNVLYGSDLHGDRRQHRFAAQSQMPLAAGRLTAGR